ncbi:MAG: thiamine pyrophosphate-dependent enzyme, partial [Eubacterium sp.]
FCENLETIYIIEENDPFIEETVRQLGFDCMGKNCFPAYGEMVPDILRNALGLPKQKVIDGVEKSAIKRLPTFCAGCPHRGFFYELGKRKNIMITGDIGCYTLAYSNPYKSLDTALCMGASFSLGHGAQTIFNREQNGTRVVGVLGDSTFFHTGINSLINTIYNGSNTINVILDNRITGMTGHQQNPGTGYTANGDPAASMSIEAMVRAIGVKHIEVIDPNNLAAINEVLDKFLALDEPSVIITRWPCVLKKL